jgi:hypothetical protein
VSRFADRFVLPAGELIFVGMLPAAYLSQKLTEPLPTKDGGTLRTIGDRQRLRRPSYQRLPPAEPMRFPIRNTA